MNFTDPVIQVFFLISFLALVPSILVMFTSFTRIIIVLSFLRQAMGTQQIPPNMVIVGLSLFLTMFIMGPTIDVVHREAVSPFMEKKISFQEALTKASVPVKTFMAKQTRQKDIALFLNIANEPVPEKIDDIPIRIIVPAFAISEIKTAFEIGFLLYLPFLIIDMVVASIIMSMGMMMLPPTLISLPFKLLLFVLVDGWNLVVGSMVRSFQ
ncbi:MAG: flagellar type III secretion system pore protein FliP [Nitrospirota bacterium]